MKLLVDLKLEVDVPEEHRHCEYSLKHWLWDSRKDELFRAMRFKEVVSPPAPVQHNTAHRLQLLDTISKVQRQYLQMEKAPVVFGGLLNALLDLMNSEYGFIGEIKYEPDGTMFLQTHAVTNIAWNDETRAFYDANVASGLRFYNLNSLFGKVMTTKKEVISNNPKDDSRACGIPKGHPPLNHFLGVPFFDTNKEIVGMVGIANKPGGYTQEDVGFLEPFVVTCSNLIQAYNAILENKRLINTLEEKVAERTRELSLANEAVLAASAAQLTHFACMSHEIRTPLNCIIGLSSLLQETDLSDKQKESLRLIITSGELLCAVVDDILDYSKLQSGNVVGELCRTNLQDALDSVIKGFEYKARRKRLGFKTFYSPLVPEYIETDNNRLQQILYNLLGNAIKFSDEGGSVELAVDLVDPEGSSSAPPDSTPSIIEQAAAASSKCPFLRTTKQTSDPAEDKSESTSGASSPPSGCPFSRPKQGQTQSDVEALLPGKPSCRGVLRFTVKDYGCGIDAKDFGRIFEPFGQGSGDTERLYGGTGLGLAITANLVERLGGRICVESELGKWSMFTVEIPVSVGSKPDTSALIHRLKDSRILYVDKPSSCDQRVIYNLELPVERFDSCQDMHDWLLEEAKKDQASINFFFCLVHEDLYSQEVFRKFAGATSSVLVTFGRQHTVAESRTHFRSISELIPCVLLQTLVALRDSGNRDHKQCVPRPLRLDIFHEVDILVAEDNLINQKVICKMLKRLGVECVDIANNGQEAVEMTAQKHYDIIFMDMQMPIMCGDEACRIICDRYKGRDRRPKIVFVTAHVSSSHEKLALDAGACGFLSKPFNIKKFEDFILSLEL